MKEHFEIVHTVFPLVVLIIAVFVHVSYAAACDDDNYSPLEVFQQKIVKNSSELCVITITPSLFKWEKYPESVFQIEYNARISNHPDLPSWLQYTYDEYRSEGFLYGVPPPTMNSLNLNVIAWNREDEYNVRKLIISLEIMEPRSALTLFPSLATFSAPSQSPPTNNYYEFVVELKIDNMNTRDVCHPRRMEKIVGVFTKYLNWAKLSGEPVRPVYLASAVDLGENQVPLKPSESEGVIMHFGSDRNFSLELFKLQSEVSPLWKLRPCPRDVKRTSMERYFRSENILLDWCSFRLVTNTQSPNVIVSTSSPEPSEEASIAGGLPKNEIFYFTSEIPEKTYGVGIILATIIPGSIASVLGFILLILFWQDREEESAVDGDSLFFEAAFRFLVSLFRCGGSRDGDSDHNNPIITGPLYEHHHQHLYRSPTGDEDVVLITRDRYSEPPKEVNDSSNGGRERTPLPPQYGETHPNGSPALIYAV